MIYDILVDPTVANEYDAEVVTIHRKEEIHLHTPGETIML